MADAVVIGAGPNGLVGANVLAESGWDVVVLEEQPTPGGSVRTAEVTVPGFRHDLFSAFYPLGIASPHMRAMELDRWGVRWRHGPLVLAHPAADGSCAVLSRELDETAASLDAFAAGDGDAWRALFRLWDRVGGHVVDALMEPFPPLWPAARLMTSLRPRALVEFLRLAMLPTRRMGEEEFRGEGGRRLLAANALHADLPPEAAPGALYGLLLCGIGQQLGYPFPEGGAGAITDALVRRLESHGGVVRCGERAVAVELQGGRAAAVRTAGGERIEASRAVLADVGAPQLYLELVGAGRLPPWLRRSLDRFQYDNSTVKVDWALDGPIPWAAPAARRAPVVHVTEGLDELTMGAAQMACGLVPAEPFLVMGQYSMGDPTRQPPGRETAWAYTHVPQRIRGDAGSDRLQGRWDDRETAAFVRRIEARIERLAPGFGGLVAGRHVFTPRSMEAANRNLVGGALNGGTAQIHQQVVFRPVAGLGRPHTPFAGLYLASASAHPGGGVHGAPGANAARAALAQGRVRRAAAAAGAVAAAGAIGSLGARRAR